MNQVKKLFEPFTVGSMTLPNRITLLPLGQARLDRKHYRDYIVKIAEGGCALVTITNSAQYDEDDEAIPYLREMAEAVHAYDGKIAAHAGTGYGPKGAHKTDYSVSEHVLAVSKTKVRAATIEEIHGYVRYIVGVAERGYQAGLDAFELHIGMGYFLNRFLSTHTNRRTDEYGGSMENRMRIVLECLEGIRNRVPKDYPIICRFSPIEFMPGGLTWDDWKPMLPILDRAGIDVWSVQPGWHESPEPLVQPSVPPVPFRYLYDEIKKLVKTPVIMAYRITDPLLAEQLLVEGIAELIGLGRQLMADPEWGNKAKEGRFDEIRPCNSCNYCLSGLGQMTKMGPPIPGEARTEPLCDINAYCGMESEYTIKPVTKAKKVFVIGGGPAGMEAAMTAASRGHKVTLYEKGDRLGGQLIPGSVPPYKDETRRLVIAMETQTKKAGVKVELNTEVKSQFVLDSKPDAVIIATGAQLSVPDIPGAKGDNVLTALEALADVAKVGNKVVVIGGGLVGCETAEFLAEKGKTVTILEMLPKLAADAYPVNRWVLRDRLTEADVVSDTNTKAVEITPEGVRGVREYKFRFYRANTVVLASGFSPKRELFRELQDKLPEVHLIGDCVEPRLIRQAIAEGHSVGNKV